MERAFVNPRFLAVKDFRRFQHYRDRNPIWIKLYTDILVDPGFGQLHEVAQAQLIKLWIFRAQWGPLPNDPKFIAGKIGVHGKFYLADIVRAGFLIPTDDPSSIERATDSASTPGDSALANEEENASSTLAETGAAAEESASGPERARARSRERGEVEREELSLLPARVRFCAAANRGLAEHPGRPQSIARVMPNAGATHEAVEAIAKAGVPEPFAESAIYEIAKAHNATGHVSSLKYFTANVIRRWEQYSAGAEASRSAPGALPTNGKSNGATPGDRSYAEATAAFDDFNRSRAAAGGD